MANEQLPADIVRGSGGNLFLVGGAQTVAEYITGEREIRLGIKRIFRENLLYRKEFCNSLGAAFLHVVCPDKHTVLVDDFPLKVVLSVGNVFADYCGDLFSFPVQDLQTDPSGPCYWLTDTHWNLSGYIVFVKHVLQSFAFDPELIETRLATVRKASSPTNSYCGDLGVKLSPRPSEPGLILRPDPSVLFYSNNISGNNGTINVTINCKIAGGRLVIFGDSFVMGSLKILGLFFREIFLVRSPYFHREIVSMFKPSHVLTSNVERYLPSIPTDREAPVALIYKDLLNKDAKPDADFYRAVDAVLQPGSLNYERFFANLR